MIDRIINTEDIKDADTILFSVPYENGVSFMSGTSKAPKKIIDCLDNYLELFDVDLLCEPAKLLKTAHEEIAGLEKFIPEEAMEKISSIYQKFIDLKKFTILLGGAHIVSFGALKAISQKGNPKDITILQIDAHQDLRDNNCDYDEKCEKFAHSCTMRRIHELGFPIVQVGVRTYSKYEYNFEMENKKTITVFPWAKNSKIPKIEAIRLPGTIMTEIIVRILIISFNLKEIRDSLVELKASMVSLCVLRISQISLLRSNRLLKYKLIESGSKKVLCLSINFLMMVW